MPPHGSKRQRAQGSLKKSVRETTDRESPSALLARDILLQDLDSEARAKQSFPSSRETRLSLSGDAPHVVLTVLHAALLETMSLNTRLTSDKPTTNFGNCGTMWS